MLGTVYFKDGHTEEIKVLDVTHKCVYFATESGHYGLTTRIEKLSDGMLVRKNVFLECYEMSDDECYYDTDVIERIEVNKEKSNG